MKPSSRFGYLACIGNNQEGIQQAGVYAAKIHESSIAQQAR
jgi:hypothetical protein